jgi:nitrogenase-associated protein
LRPFFSDLPVAQWFNPSAPKIKSGAVDPSKLDAQTALDMMIVEPLLIRRPLMEVNGVFSVGFEAKAVDAWIGLNDSRSKEEDANPPCNHTEPCKSPAVTT